MLPKFVSILKIKKQKSSNKIVAKMNKNKQTKEVKRNYRSIKILPQLSTLLYPYKVFVWWDKFGSNYLSSYADA